MSLLSASLLGIKFANPLLNASGVHCRYTDELDALAASAAGSLITKSCTLLEREGNPEPRYAATALGSINSMGLPNQGYAYYLDYARRHNYATKPLFFSVAGLSLEDNLTMMAAVRDAYIPAIVELNLSCPNVPGKPQIAYDFEAMDRMLAAVSAEYALPFGVKMPPYFDIAHFDAAAAILNKYPLVAFVTCINSIGNALVIDIENESVVIKPKDGFGGIGGDYVLPTALANVNAFYRRCPDKQVIGCGGVRSGEQVFMHLLAGASLVQVGTALHEDSPRIFARLNRELSAIMERKGYRSIEALRGKLKTL
ncbi:dihydroorotate oxidase [Uliginosibacterium aquaticum]|uniref:dihydroorotate oxidase (fumarate) n=1 Tax=Uliginosibacterium aquaticum TaxID=2731212 RepID=A0ABX2ILG8_9RHOO|nr:dihydroorotate oxidase [Uliginosibacterium aquaticum]NSL55524.1 dihydroorotate oxidase [Uliginosibacterium aquaticum]